MKASNQDPAIATKDGTRFAKFLTIIRTLQQSSAWTDDIRHLLGNDVSGGISQAFYFDLITHKERILEQAKNDSSHSMLFGESYIQHIFRLHVYMRQRVLETTYVQKSLYSIAKDFVELNFKIGSQVLCQYTGKGNCFTPMNIQVKTNSDRATLLEAPIHYLNKHSQTGNDKPSSLNKTSRARGR